MVATCVGYTQGNTASPSYEQVCSGTTAHTEGIQLLYDPAVVTYEGLCKKLLSTIDATLRNQVGNDRGTQYRDRDRDRDRDPNPNPTQVGNDRGTQYRHGIYPHTEAQREVAERCLQQEQAR